MRPLTRAPARFARGASKFGDGKQITPWPPITAANEVSWADFHELQREAIAFADLAIAGFVAIGEPGRQSPDAFFVILGVLGIGVDLRARQQPEACRFDESNRVLLVHVTRGRLRILRNLRIAAMSDDAEHTARLEGRVHKCE